MGKGKETAGKRAVLFAGTTEGRLLAGYLAFAGCPAVVCVATEYGREILEHGLDTQEADGTGTEADMWSLGKAGAGMGSLTIRRGRLDQNGMERLFDEVRPGMVIDATHPYAVEVTKTIRRACESRPQIRLVRCLRDSSSDCEGVVRVPDTRAAASWLGQREGNILVATGAKELGAFCTIEGYRERVYARVLPSVESIQACKDLGFEGRHVIAMQGPFSRNMNLAMLQEFDCRYLVTKDGGRAGGLYEKLEAAWGAGAVAVLIDRPGKDQGFSLDDVKMQIKEWISHEG